MYKQRKRFKNWDTEPTQKPWQSDRDFKEQQRERADNAETLKKLGEMGCKFGRSGYEDPGQ